MERPAYDKKRSTDRNVRCGADSSSSWISVVRRYASVLAAVMAVGCSSPTARVDRLAVHSGLSRSIVLGAPFNHVVYFKAGSPSSQLHVYVEHDGIPWLNRRTVSSDPTPRDPIMLKLMMLDPAPAVYLGRPCYFGLASEPACEPRWWTSGRYSERIVDSMAAALIRFLATRPSSDVVLLGYSGGGTLAVLLAPRLPGTRAVVTLAGNLDVTAWSAYHHYTPLDESLDPADRGTPHEDVLEWHFLAAADTNVPPSIVSRYFITHPYARSIVIQGFDHSCCWDQIWPGLLAALNTMLQSRERLPPPAFDAHGR